MAALSSNSAQLDPKKEERRDYIESRTRIHLERNGELPDGGSGEIVEGRRVDRGEVEALETVVGMLDETER